MVAWLATLMTCFGILLNANKKLSCWPVWLLSNVLWTAYLAPKGEWAAVGTNVFLFASNVYGWISWHKAKKEEAHQVNLENTLRLVREKQSRQEI